MNRKFTLILFLTVISSITFGQQYSWKQKADFGGMVRVGAFSFVIDSLGYVGGGYVPTSNYNDFWEYHPSTNSWTQKSNIPLAVRMAGAFSINGKGYYTGGIKQTVVMSNDLYEYDPVANTWTSKAPFPGIAIYGGASFAINGKGYYGIGNGGSATGPYYTAFYEYDPVSNSWSQKATFPGASRYGTFGISANGKGYAGFGGNEAISLTYNDWWEYDPLNNTWTLKAILPGVVRAYPSGFVINNKIYLGVGRSYNQFPIDFYEYDPISDVWAQKQNFAGGSRVVAVGFSIDSIGYLGTGADSVNYYRDFWEYSPDTSTAINENNFYTSNIKIFPNPFNEELTVSCNQFIKDKTQIKLFDIYGRTVLSQPLTTAPDSNRETKLQTGKLSSGIYIYEVRNNSGVIKKGKVVKE